MKFLHFLFEPLVDTAHFPPFFVDGGHREEVIFRRFRKSSSVLFYSLNLLPFLFRTPSSEIDPISTFLVSHALVVILPLIISISSLGIYK